MRIEERAKRHNASIDEFWDEMEAIHGKTVNIQDWFWIQQELEKREFRKKGLDIVDEARANKLDYKISMQTYKIIY